MINSFIDYEKGILAKCIWGCNLKATIKNGLLLGVTSKIFYETIHSKTFFRALVSEMERDHPYLRYIDEGKWSLLNHRAWALRGYVICKTDKFINMPCGEPWVSEEGLELISFNNGIQSFPVRENLPFAEGFSFPMLDNRAGGEYFVFSENATVHVYKADRKTLHASFEIEGEICQITVHEHFLCVIEQDVESVCFLVVYNLLQVQEDPTNIVLPGDYITPLCFGKDHLIYVESFFKKDIVYVLPLNQFGEHSWPLGIETKGHLYYFAREDHFIEVKFTEACFSISKAQVDKEGFIRSPITKEIAFLKNGNGEIDDVHFHHNRLFFSCEIARLETKLFSYDIELCQLTELTTVPNFDEGVLISPRFLSAAEKVYYIGLNLESDDVTCHLTTLTYGKI